MGKKGKKKQTKVVQDLESFNKQALKEQQEKEFSQVQKSAKTQDAEKQASQNLSSALEDRVDKFQIEDLQQINFYCQMDNKLIEAYYAKKENFSDEEKDILAQEEFLFYLRQLVKDLDYLINLEFVSFWGVFKKIPEVIRFLDGFILNVRKFNDIYKVQFDSGESVEQNSKKVKRGNNEDIE